MERQAIKNLAEKIAVLLRESESQDNDFLPADLGKINHRPDKIESQIEVRNPKFKVQSPKITHYSQEKFTSLKELADEIVSDFQIEKICPYEPAGKPCDNCSMCNSRGF